MALRGVKGPDRVLYALSGILQNKLPSVISAYNINHKCMTLLTINDSVLVLESSTTLTFNTNSTDYTINFPAGTYTLSSIKTTINAANSPLTAYDFSDYAILLMCSSSIKFTSAFANIKSGQIVNYQPLTIPNSYIISSSLPSENEIKNYPSVVIELSGVSPDDSGIVTTYDATVTFGVVSQVSTSQTDYLSKVLMQYYDCFESVIMNDDGSLGGICNGVNIQSAGIDDATGTNYFLKYLTITLSISVEED